MKKVILKTVDLVKFNNFIDSLIPLDEASTIYFKIDQEGIRTDAHNSSGTLIKSMRMQIGELCGESNLDGLSSPIKLCFYDGNKVKKAFSFLSGGEIKVEIVYSELDGEYFGETMKVSSPKISLTLDAADPTLFEFANVPEEKIAEVKDTSSSDCKFKMTANEILQVKKFMDFDSSDELEFKVNGQVKVCSEGSYSIDIDEEFEGLNQGGEKSYKLDKKLFRAVDANSYNVYPILDEDKIIFETIDKTMEVVITLHEEVEL
tara:strand:+ start:22380 stop:23162 length:783 start_codon:yes stop_codon:yes gene_type:complete